MLRMLNPGRKLEMASQQRLIVPHINLGRCEHEVNAPIHALPTQLVSRSQPPRSYTGRAGMSSDASRIGTIRDRLHAFALSHPEVKQVASPAAGPLLRAQRLCIQARQSGRINTVPSPDVWSQQAYGKYDKIQHSSSRSISVFAIRTTCIFGF